MSPVTSAVLGILFVGIGLANTFFMFHLWGYPFDKATRTSAAPKPLMLVHRLIGFAFAALFVFMVVRMAPRLWSYQVEFPARTVVHMVLAISLGFLLLVKIAILRSFRHLEEWMPYLGTGVALCAVVLIGLSAPFAFRERALAARAEGGGAFAAENLARLAGVLPEAGFPNEASIPELCTPGSLREGRAALLGKCVRCHDLRTVLGRPRAPADWLRTVVRMAEKPALFDDPIAQDEAWKVAAYLVAITPDLQRSAKRIREGMTASATDRLLAILDEADVPAVDPAAAEAALKKACSQCHTPLAIEDAKPATREALDELLARMVRNGLSCDEQELRVVRAHLLNRFVPAK